MKKAFSLLEVVISVFILTISLTILFKLMSNSINTIKIADDRFYLLTISNEIINSDKLFLNNKYKNVKFTKKNINIKGIEKLEYKFNYKGQEYIIDFYNYSLDFSQFRF